ncbi:hypothetical protein ASF43_08645 [Pseudorhodoferax sp. Leaf267]|nr:hypothetical protein ASF43_08645 [Pseudorhodoferax sp. Leaf267]
MNSNPELESPSIILDEYALGDQEEWNRRQRWLLFALVTPLLASTFLAKISVPPLGGMGFGISMPLTLLITALLACTSVFVVNTERLLLYTALIGTTGLVQAVQDARFSLNSFIFLAAFFAPFIFQFKPQQRAERVLGSLNAYYIFGQVATCLAICGVVQYGAQFVIGARYAFPIEFFLPDIFTVQGYNNLNPLSYRANVFKANGVFMLEPSTFSQITALGLLFELSFWARKSRLAIYIGALALTYSGTGILILIVGLGALVVFNRRWDIILVGACAVGVLAIFAEPLNLNVFLNRATEVQSTGSSGFARFGAWVYVFKEHWLVDPFRILFGLGAGSFTKYSFMSQYVAAEMGFSKIFFEYGLIGGTIFFYFLIRLIFMSRLPIACSLGLCTMLFLNGAYSPTVMGIFTSVLLWPVFAPKLEKVDESITAGPDKLPES